MAETKPAKQGPAYWKFPGTLGRKDVARKRLATISSSKKKVTLPKLNWLEKGKPNV